MSEQEWRLVNRLILPPTVLIVVPALIALRFIRTEEAALMMFVLTRPLVPSLLIVWGALTRRVQRMFRSQDAAALAAETGARSGSEVAVASYLGLFVPFVVFCTLSAACAVMNASGSSSEVVVTGQVERVNFGRWTRAYSATVRQPDHTEITLPIHAADANALKFGSTFTKQYRRGALGILFLP